MECHGRLIQAWGPAEPGPTFTAFVEALRSAAVGTLLPGIAAAGDVWSQRLLDDEGLASPWLSDLAMAVGTDAVNAPGIGFDIRHLHSVLRALQRLPAHAGLARISAEAVQHAVFRALLEAGFAAYTAGREALVRTPAIARRQLAKQVALLELGVYTDIAASRQFAGWWMPCPICNWTMRATPSGAGAAEFACEDARHRQRGCRFLAERTGAGWSVRPLGELRQAPKLVPVEGWVALSFALWRWITIPGLLEIELCERARSHGAQVDLWPGGDAYDLRIVKRLGSPHQVVWKVDVKTWADAQGIGSRLREEPDDLQGLCVVIPENQRGYLGVLNTVLGPFGARVITDVDLFDEVAQA